MYRDQRRVFRTFSSTEGHLSDPADMLNATAQKYLEYCKVPGQVLLSFICFRLMQFAVRWYLFGRCTFRTFSYFNRGTRNENSRNSKSLQNVPPNKKWRISNELVSLVHSAVSGFWALYCLLILQDLIDNMVHFDDERPRLLLVLTTGYLLHDLVDLLINERSVRILELLFHHVIVLTAFSIYWTSTQFLGVVVCGLLMELNSIFLHSRSLLNLYGVEKKSPGFRVIALLNICTFMVFRMAVSMYLIYWQITYAWSMKWYITLVTAIVIYSLAVTNTILCYRVMAADGLLGKKRRRSRPSKPTDEEVDADDEDEEDDTDDDLESGRRTGEVTNANGATRLPSVTDANGAALLPPTSTEGHIEAI
uniref:TLC domain-containing protein n=1 Tax=Steinernema glaseri TaxID=37863 RepID=A0A1I7ZUM8_9BILA